jgi:hypothetical protein
VQRIARTTVPDGGLVQWNTPSAAAYATVLELALTAPEVRTLLSFKQAVELIAVLGCEFCHL